MKAKVGDIIKVYEYSLHKLLWEGIIREIKINTYTGKLEYWSDWGHKGSNLTYITEKDEDEDDAYIIKIISMKNKHTNLPTWW